MMTITLDVPDELALRLNAERDRLPQMLSAADRSPNGSSQGLSRDGYSSGAAYRRSETRRRTSRDTERRPS